MNPFSCESFSSESYISWPDQEVLIIPNAYLLMMKTILILLSLLAAVSLASAYTPEELTSTKNGVQLSFKLGQAYEKANQGVDVAGFNALVDQWNAWVMGTFGNDASLIMEKMAMPLSLQKPYIAAGNNTSDSMRGHQMDSRAEYTTNDANLLPDAARAKYAASEQGRVMGMDYLGGI